MKNKHTKLVVLGLAVLAFAATFPWTLHSYEEIVVKDGGNPCVVALGADLFPVAPEPVQDIVDTTGAGDSFNAGYIAARMSNREPVDAAKLGHCVAGRVIRERGALLSMASFSDLVVA